MKNIGIIGCGYLGMKIASLWSKRGFHITATTRTPERLKELAKVAQKGMILKGNNEEEFVPLFSANDTLLVTISADSREQYESAYLHTAQVFRKLSAEMKTPKHLIYTSSTSVYGDHHGLWVDEASPLLAKQQPSKILIETENTYLSLKEFGWHVCILRLAEIYGPGRELSKRVRGLEGHPLPGAGDHYTNMVHAEDCVAAIDYALNHRLEGIFNLADDDHPLRQELYDEVAQKYHLPKISWDPSCASFHTGNKRVSNHKIKAAGFTLPHPHRLLD